jgi:hypothetical protein
MTTLALLSVGQTRPKVGAPRGCAPAGGDEEVTMASNEKPVEDDRCGRRERSDRRLDDHPVPHAERRTGKNRRSGSDRRTEPRAT